MFPLLRQECICADFECLSFFFISGKWVFPCLYIIIINQLVFRIDNNFKPITFQIPAIIAN